MADNLLMTLARHSWLIFDAFSTHLSRDLQFQPLAKTVREALGNAEE